jgi:hypothetical protein
LKDPWPTLRERYDQVVVLYALRYPGDPLPDFPAGGDPNGAIMVIDQMLARMEDRAPVRISYGKPYVVGGGDGE